MNAARAIARLGLQEALRRRVFLVVALLTVAFLVPLRARHLAGVRVDRGDERRSSGASSPTSSPARRCSAWPCSGRCSSARSSPSSSRSARSAATPSAACCSRCSCGRCRAARCCAARFAAAALVCGAYVIVVFLIADRDHLGARRLVARPHRSSPRSASPPRSRSSCALSLAGSVFLSSTANGIAVFMVFGAGLVAGPARPDRRGARLRHAARTSPTIASWLLPFEALYQAALGALTADTVGFTRLAIDLGPFGGAEDFGPLLWPWALAYLGARRRARPAGVRAPRPLSAGRGSPPGVLRGGSKVPTGFWQPGSRSIAAMSLRETPLHFVFVPLALALALAGGASSPAVASDTRPPRIVAAAMQDADGDARADRLRLRFSERVRHAADRDGRYPLRVAGYRIRAVGTAKGTDGRADAGRAGERRRRGAARGPLRADARGPGGSSTGRGNQAARQAFRATRAHGNRPGATPDRSRRPRARAAGAVAGSGPRRRRRRPTRRTARPPIPPSTRAHRTRPT